MKRKFSDLVYTEEEKINPDLFRKYTPGSIVTGSRLRNYMLKDSLVDWLKLYGEKKDTYKPSLFTEFIMQRGIDFENAVVNYISKKIPVVKNSDTVTDESCAETLRLMKLKVPIIHSAPFRIPEKEISGTIDLLVRCDVLKDIVYTPPPMDYDIHHPPPSPPSDDDTYYVVIDIKFSTLQLRADGIYLLNSDNIPAYKAQVWLYTQSIGELQGYTPRYGYILGRRWSYTSKGVSYNGINCFDRLGTIDYKGVDKEYIAKTQDAINWIKDLEKYGKDWSISPPSRIELYPNMCIDSGEYQPCKQKIADDIGDISQIWYCGVKERDMALSHNVQGWKDKRCTTSLLNLHGTRAHVIDKIMEINRNSHINFYTEKIPNNTNKNNNNLDLPDWRKENNEVFVDFETLADINMNATDCKDNMDDPETWSTKADIIFMIGVWYKQDIGGQYCYSYKNFTARKDTRDEEFRIMDEFRLFLKELKEPILWFWHAEKNIWEKAEEWHYNNSPTNSPVRDIISNWKITTWADLAKFFREIPIVIKGCFNFGLKNIAKAMREYKMITADIESDCKSGLDAAIMAYKAYKASSTHDGQTPGLTPSLTTILADISRYNEFDVKVLQEILSYLRKFR